MTKSRVSLMLIALSVILVASLSVGLFQESEGTKGQGVSLTETGSKKVCGDRLCSESIVSSPDKKMHIQTSSQTSECKSNEGKIRTYYIAADEIEWDYAPSGLNQIKAHEFNEDEKIFVENTSDRIGSKYIRHYTKSILIVHSQNLNHEHLNGSILER
ncbi:hypothetical protein [Nitrosopumilus sp.]|uniref:hypothetical protein n=1 Tax=Nitrosopumilus sp. TaxID=2024843 RepID=UPI00247C354B|nr:hypothetical protein [Nitrosopumilus sp.]MCV0430129.1 hypothetical protein [Nitrosopumilus sp.]